MTPLVFVVTMLVVYRLTMLVVADELTEPWREKIIDRYIHPAHELTHRPEAGAPDVISGRGFAFVAVCRCGMSWTGDNWSDVMSEANGHTNEHRGEQTTGPKWLVLLDCPWCASFWIACPVTWSAWCFGERGWWMVPALAFAGSAVTGIIASYAKPG